MDATLPQGFQAVSVARFERWRQELPSCREAWNQATVYRQRYERTRAVWGYQLTDGTCWVIPFLAEESP